MLRASGTPSSPTRSLAPDAFLAARRGFTDLTREDYRLYREEGRLVNDGSHVKLVNHKGPVADRDPALIFSYPARMCSTPVHRVGEADEE